MGERLGGSESVYPHKCARIQSLHQAQAGLGQIARGSHVGYVNAAAA
jgi:hypothetical protein